VSSHAANSLAAATFIALILRHRAVTLALMAWALLQCYSRVYLGVHYPGDIVGGMLVGIIAGWLVWRVMLWIEHRWHMPRGYYTRDHATVMVWAVCLTVMGIIVAAAIQSL